MLLAQTHRRESSPLILILGLCLSVITTTVAAQERTLATVTDASVQAQAVLKPDNQVAIRVRVPGQQGGRELPLSPAVLSVVKLVVSPNKQRIGVIGDVGGNTFEVSAVDVSGPSIANAVLAFAPAVSPSGRFIVYEQHRVRNALTHSAVYGMLDLESTASAGGLTPMRIYPDDSLTHGRQSEFYWLASDIVAFLDMAGADSRVVVVRLNADGKIDDVVVKPLDVDRLVNAADIDSSAPPASALYGPVITRLGDDGLTVRLKFPAGSALKARRVDVRIW